MELPFIYEEELSDLIATGAKILFSTIHIFGFELKVNFELLDLKSEVQDTSARDNNLLSSDSIKIKPYILLWKTTLETIG